MALTKKPYKGTRDFYPNKKRIQNHIFSEMKKTAELFGHEPYDGPLLEDVELYQAKSGDELINEQIYSFHDRGNRFVAIRPEMTPTLARMISSIHREYPKPIRWYSIPNLMRYEQPQKGRLREHWQFNCDIFGAPESMGNLEILQMAISLLNNLGADSKHFEVLINDRRLVDYVLNGLMKVDSVIALKLYKIIDKSKKISREIFEKMLNELNLSDEKITLFNQYLNLANFSDVFKFIDENNIQEKMSDFVDLINNTKTLGLDEYLKYDPTIVRGLDYYTGIVFEIFDKHPENRRAICGGGSYANLLQIFNEPAMSGVGFGLGDVTLTDFLEIHNLIPKSLYTQTVDLFLTIQDTNCRMNSLKLTSLLRKNRIRTILNFGPIKIKKVFSLAEKRGARFVGFMGENELKNNTVQLKDMITKEQSEPIITDLPKLIEILKKQGLQDDK